MQLTACLPGLYLANLVRKIAVDYLTAWVIFCPYYNPHFTFIFSVKMITSTFPSEDGEYTGFIDVLGET